MSTCTRAKFENVAAGAAALLGVLTVVWKDWIEVVFGIDPDHADGTLEWLIVGSLLVAAIAFFALSRWEMRRAIPSSS